MGLDALLKRLTETPETPHVSPDVSPEPAWIKAETCETPETCEKNITANAATSWRWLLHFADREPMAVYFNPDASFDKVMADYPDALAAEPIPERIKQVFTEADDAEWEAQWLAVPGDDRITCAQCANLNERLCLAARRGEIVASRNYEPIRDFPRRCAGYALQKNRRINHANY